MVLTGPHTRLSSSKALSSAVYEFQASLNDERKAQLLALSSVPREIDVLTFTAELDRANAARKRRGVASRFCTILESIQQYSAVMDTYSQVKADTTSLVWGSVKLCIQVASSAASYYDKLSEWFMRLGTLCPRLEEWKKLFSNSAALQKALDAFFATVVRFCMRAVQVLDRTGIFNFVSSLWKPFEIEFGVFEREMKHKKNEIDDEIRLATAQAIKQDVEAGSRFREDLTKSLTSWHSSGEARYSMLEKAKFQDQKVRLLNQLSSFEYKVGLKENRKKRHGSTGSWLMAQQEYQSWFKDKCSSFLLLWGGVGCGKSVLAAATIDDLLRHCNIDDVGVSFIFCKENDAESVSATTILRSLIRQSLTVDVVSATLQLQISSVIADATPEPGMLKDLFTLATRRFRTHFIVIDGWDECTTSDQRDVMDVLGRVAADTLPSHLKVVIASCDNIIKDVPRSFSSRYSLTISRKHVDTDIAAFIDDTLRAKIDCGELLVGDPKLVADVQRALVDGADGMFLWVAFQIREICEQTCDEDIRGVIAQLPKGLRETYERILQRVCQRGKASIADKVFRWTGTVRRPLTLEEMHEAIAVQPGQDSFRHDRLTNGFFENVVSWCGNLVTVDEESRAVQFAHSTVRQYLFSDDAAPTRFRCVPDEANTHVGEVCVTYLCFSDFERQLVKNSKVAQAVDPTAIASAALSSAGGKALVKPLKMFASMRKGPRIVPVNLLAQRLEDHSVGRSLAAQFSFLAYASQHWIAHTSNFSVTTHAWRHFLRLVLEDSHVASLSSHLRSSNNKMLLKRYIVGLNHKGLMHCLCHCRHHIFDNISLGKLFCECCHRKVVDIAKMALSSTKAVEENMSQWVVAAAEAGLQDVLGMLIDMAPQSESRSSLLALALQSAARGGHCGIVVQMLNVGADVNFPAICTLTALEEAINRPDTEMLELLLDHGAKFGAEPARLIGLKWERSMPTSLRLATWYRRDGLDLRLELRGDRLEFLERLLLAGAAVNCAPPPVCGRTALQAASELGLLDIVERLLVAGADVNAPPAEEFGRTALQAAAGAGDFAIVNRLLDAGAAVDADPAPCWGRTALQAAAEAGHLEIVNRLLEAGANVNEEPASDFGRTALQAAAEAGKLDMVDRLLAAGAEPNAAPCHVGGVTALQAATQAGHPEVMVRLREEGAVEVAEDT